MASSMKSCLIIFFACSFFIQAALAEVICENLPENHCAFAVSSSGLRCALESFKNENADGVDYRCTTLQVAARKYAGHVESDECVAACGVDRRFLGISSDAFMAPNFISSLCSAACYDNCPNIAELYFKVAAGEDVFLQTLCAEQKSNPHRSALELLSSSGAAAADSSAPAPAPAP